MLCTFQLNNIDFQFYSKLYPNYLCCFQTFSPFLLSQKKAAFPFRKDSQLYMAEEEDAKKSPFQGFDKDALEPAPALTLAPSPPARKIPGSS